MISILLQILVCGLATAAICRTIAYYDGPFRIIPRFKEKLLPMMCMTPKASTYKVTCYHDLEEKFSEILMADQQDQAAKDLWKTYHTLYNPKFYLSLRGTLYDMLDCPFCLGPYVSFLMATLSTAYVYTVTELSMVTLAINVLLVSCGTYGLHFLISKRWENNA